MLSHSESGHRSHLFNVGRIDPLVCASCSHGKSRGVDHEMLLRFGWADLNKQTNKCHLEGVANW